MRKIFIIMMLGVSVLGNAETLTLQQCLEKAKTNNRELQNAALDILAADEKKKEAFAKYFPQISANVIAFHAFDKILKMEGNYPTELKIFADIPGLEPLAALAGQPYSYSALNKGYGATLSVVEPLYAGGNITATNKLAQVQKDCMELQRSLKEKDVLQKVTENFWQIATLKYNLRTIEAAEKQIAEVHRNVTNFVKAGVTTHNALLKVKLRQNELASNRLRIENGTHVLLMLLAQQIGATVEDFDIVLPEDGNIAAMPEHASADAVNNREEMKLAEKMVTAKQLQIKKERSKLLPVVAVGAVGYNLGFGPFENDHGLGSLDIKNNMTNGLALATISVPISEWWTSNHAVKKAKFQMQQAKNDYLDAQEKLRIDNEAAWCNVTEAYKQIEIAKSGSAEAEENLRMSMNQYKAGTETLTDLLDAETLNRKAQDQLSAAIATYNVRLADYQRKIR